MPGDGIHVPGRKGGRQRLSFADFDELLCLLQRTDVDGRLILPARSCPSPRGPAGVAGGVAQVHIVSYARLLDEILTRTGVGTMIERHQTHQVDYAQSTDLDAVEQLYLEAQRFTTRRGTPYVKPRSRAELERLLPSTLLLEHRDVIIGMLHATEVPDAEGALLIGGFVIAENHQDSQHGQLLLCEALSRFREQGYMEAAAITASDRAKRLFDRNCGRPEPDRPWQKRLLEDAVPRYQPKNAARCSSSVRSADGKRRVTTAGRSRRAGGHGAAAAASAAEPLARSPGIAYDQGRLLSLWQEGCRPWHIGRFSCFVCSRRRSAR